MTPFEEERPITRVQWTLGNQCNYSCVYCHEMFRKGDKPFPSEELIAEVCKDIVYHFDDLGRDVEFEFIGGEHTPRNLMIRAVKTGAQPDPSEEGKYQEMLSLWKVKPALAALVSR